MVRVGEHAIVLGASMAGLLTARVLCDFYDRVTVVERDELTDAAEPRRGVPQSGQPHALLARCAHIAEELFPGILDELVADGAHRWDDGDLSKFHASFGGHRLVSAGRIPDPASLVNHYASRPFIEWHVRRRLRALPNVTMLDGHDVVDVVADAHRVAGARIMRQRDQVESIVFADVVVDATGRGSRTPVFLERLGYGRPDVDELAVRVAYASMPVRIPEGAIHEQLIFRIFEPGRSRGFAMFLCERDVWMVAAATLGDVPLPTTLDELIACGLDAAPEYVLQAVRACEPLGALSVYRYPCNRWRRYDKLTRFPDGFVVLGDAFCSFNPIYGQGMTIAAIEATILRDCLRRGGADLPRRFYKAAARQVRVAWQTAVGADLTLPDVEGPRPLSMRISNAYIDRVLAAAETDVTVAQEFLRVTGMVQPPGALMRPAFMARVAMANLGRKPRRPAPDAVPAPVG
jgi:2-polyprenyl-6-methoxyphenol hydroxylase-like FAD-dependent oxidoreductase